MAISSAARSSAPSARPAATLVVGRDGAGGIEVLVLRRSRSSRFAPGFAVFPGGAVEPTDRALALRWFGSAEHVARASAVRELREEAALEVRVDGIVGMANGRAAGGARLDASALPEIARWVAPDFLPVRFDARFFAARARADAEPSPDRVEIEAAWWISPGEALAAQRRGDLALMWPTLKMLEALATCRTVADAMALHVKQIAPPAAPMALGTPSP